MAVEAPPDLLFATVSTGVTVGKTRWFAGGDGSRNTPSGNFHPSAMKVGGRQIAENVRLRGL
jgi:hypothetical protein